MTADSRTTKAISTYPNALTGLFPLNLKVRGHSLTLANDIGALEDCLALERSYTAKRQVSQVEGIYSPLAVPYCDFLMLRNQAGQLIAASRLMRLVPENPILSLLESGRFHLSPLLIALRYSRESLLEMGSPVFLKGCEPSQAAHFLWFGMIQYMERNGLGFVFGSDNWVNPLEAKESLTRWMDVYGLHPDLEVEPVSDFREPSRLLKGKAGLTESKNSEPLPPGLREALGRGCRLATEPILNANTRRWEFVWVAFREMLETGWT